MSGGALLAARMALQYAKPWQQIVIMAVVIAAGIALIAVGDLEGVVLVVFGLVVAALFHGFVRPDECTRTRSRPPKTTPAHNVGGPRRPTRPLPTDEGPSGMTIGDLLAVREIMRHDRRWRPARLG